MSYDIYLRAEKCAACGQTGEEPGDLPGPTYNLTPIFDLALTGEPMPNEQTSEFAVVIFGEKTDRPRGLRILNGRKASTTVTLIENALKRLADPSLRAQFDALAPDNGWGTVNDAVYVFGKLKEAAADYPDLKWEIR